MLHFALLNCTNEMKKRLPLNLKRYTLNLILFTLRGLTCDASRPSVRCAATSTMAAGWSAFLFTSRP